CARSPSRRTARTRPTLPSLPAAARPEWSGAGPRRAPLLALSVGNGDLAGHDRPRPRQAAEPRQIAHEGERGDERGQLHRVAGARLRHGLPEEPEERLGDRNGPDRPVEVAPLVPLPLRGGLDARQPAERAE